MNTIKTNQAILVSLEELVPMEHTYRKFAKLINFETLLAPLEKALSTTEGAKGYGIKRLFKCLLLQIMEDISDRELAQFLEENTAGKWFCGFSLVEKTPDYSLFSRVRERIGVKRLSQLFETIREGMKSQGYISEVFSFVDASHLISKANLWEERDKAIAKKYDRLNNEVLPEVAVDKEARIGCKGKKKFWVGYKKHASVDMQSGIINKVAITPANVTDAKGMAHICPDGGVVFGDKGYCTSDVQEILKQHNCSNATIQRNNMKGKDKERDKWRSKMRAPFERVFSKTNHRVRYRGVAKNQFYLLMETIGINIKRLVVLDAPPLLNKTA